MSREQEQKDIWQELRETHKSKVERPSRDFVDLPSHRDRQHFQRSDNERAFDLIQREVEVSERSEARVRFGRRHVLLICHRATLKEMSFRGTERRGTSSSLTSPVQQGEQVPRRSTAVHFSE